MCLTFESKESYRLFSTILSRASHYHLLIRVLSGQDFLFLWFDFEKTSVSLFSFRILEHFFGVSIIYACRRTVYVICKTQLFVGQDGSKVKVLYHWVWWTKFELWDPHGGKKEPTCLWPPYLCHSQHAPPPAYLCSCMKWINMYSIT